MILQGKRVLVVGTGISGISAVKLIEYGEGIPILFDENNKLSIEEVQKKLNKDSTVEIYLGELPKEVADRIDILLLSPGVPCDTPFVEEFRRREIPIWGEIELGFGMEKGTVAAITGTNGKTTTTSLVGEILKEYYQHIFVVGNIGNPYTSEVLHTTSDSVTVAEISSFQLETIEHFHPSVSAILNITPDHLNRHHTMENYILAKEEIAKNQTREDLCVLNYDNPYTKAFGPRCKAKVLWFSSQEELEDGLFLKGEEIYLAQEGKRKPLLNIHTGMNLVGMCNVENVMAAIGICIGMKVPMQHIISGVAQFKAVEHRIEYVATKAGVDYFNDSKGTNPDAAIQGIKAMSKPTLLIAGGYDKESLYDDWVANFHNKVKLLVLIGQTKEKIAQSAANQGFQPVVFAETMEEAFAKCVEAAQSGDAVLLSPACASWGMFPNYEVRGKIFKDLVGSLEE